MGEFKSGWREMGGARRVVVCPPVCLVGGVKGQWGYCVLEAEDADSLAAGKIGYSPR